MSIRHASTICLLLGLLLASTKALPFNPLDPNNSYDYILLTADSLSAQADRLVAHRSAEYRACRVTLAEVRSAFAGADDSEKIRNFVLEAYQNWKIAPEFLLLLGDADQTTPGTGYDLLPTHYEWNDYYSENGNRWFADDGYYAKSPFAGDEKPILYIGRIPARTPAQAANAIDKILYYDGITDSPAWLGRILMLVGDANINKFNGIYQDLNDQLAGEELAQWGPLATTYSSDYDISGWPENVTADTREKLNLGYGFVNAFGNTMNMGELVLCADFNLSTGPTFTESLNSGNNMFPVVFAGSCLVNHFYRNFESSIGEDLLLKEPDRGAVAVIGATHVNEITESYEINRYFVHEMVHEGVANVGRLFTSAKTHFFLQGLGYETFGRQYTLLGDPALDIKLHPLPGAQEFTTGFEIEDAPVLQDMVIDESSSGITNENLRVVHTGLGITPLQSERMLRATLTDGTGAPFIEWKIQDLDLSITRNTILSFWMNVSESPSGNCKIMLDGNTTGGRLRNNPDIFDQNGIRLDANTRTPIEPGWQFVYSDLSALEGETLTDLRLRYATTVGADAGDLTAYFDEIRIEETTIHGGSEILNVSFENDRDGNGTPDFWTDLQGTTTTGNVQRSDNFSYDGTYSMMVRDEWCNGQGAQHIFHTFGSVGEYFLGFRYMAPDATTFCIKVIDAGSGTELFRRELTTSSAWQEFDTVVPNPAYYFGTGRIAIQIIPLDCGSSLYVDRMNITEWEDVGVESAQSPPGHPRFGGITPNPVPRNASARIRFELPRSSNVAITFYNTAGREVARIPAAGYSAGFHELAWDPIRGRVAPGVYFMKFSVDEKPRRGAEKVTILR